MSLKAKIEAVIYASEEPVTLAQLVGLLGQEAEAEMAREESAQASLALNESEADPDSADRPDILNETEEDLEAAAETDPALVGEPSALQNEDGDGAEEPNDRDAAIEPGEANGPQESPDLIAAGADSEPAEGEGVLQVEREAAPGPAEEGSVPRETSGTESGDPMDAVEAPGPSGEPAVPEVDQAAMAKAERARMTRLRAYFRQVMDSLIADYVTGDRGLEIREVAGGFRFATKPEYHDAVRGFVRSLKPPLKLSLQALETLAVIAYKQPITAPEISEIRGVDSGGVLGSLMTRKLISTAGRKQVIGRPILYKTTKDFLLKFGLKDINELPSIEEFERMAGQMAEQEEIPMPDAADPRPDVDPALEQSAEKLEPQRFVHSPQADGESAPADNLESVPEEKAGVDGRLPSLPPNYDAAELSDNPSAQEAEIQSEQGS